MTSPVSRETPPAPDEASGVFADCLSQVERYAAILTGPGCERGMIGPREVPRLWERHLLNCGLLAPALGAADEVADVGSGAGLPGVLLALLRPGTTVSVVEPMLRRTTFLAEVAEELGLTNLEVVRARAEDLHGSRTWPVVTARAVAPLDRLARWTLPLLAPGGELVAMKGSSAAAEVDGARGTIRRLGGQVVGVEQYGAGVVDPPTTVVRVRGAGRPPRRD